MRLLDWAYNSKKTSCKVKGIYYVALMIYVNKVDVVDKCIAKMEVKKFKTRKFSILRTWNFNAIGNM